MVEKIQVSIDKIMPYWRNARDNNDKAIETVARSIKEFGYQSPILVDKEMTIIAGHTRYKALKKLGVKVVDVLVSDMDGKKAKEYRIIDNRTTEYSNWIIDNVIAEYEELPNKGLVEELFPQIKVETEPNPLEPAESQIEPSESKTAQATGLQDGDYVDIICPNCFNGFQPTWKEIKQLLGE